MPAEATFPVQVLREHTTALEAAISVCMADPDHKPVHKLRTETRRVEAELLLLSQLPEVPEHRKEADVLLKQLKLLRRAAGEVRDLDVHLKILEENFEQDADEGSAENGAGAQVKTAQGTASKSQNKRRNSAKGSGANGSESGADAAERVLQKGVRDLSAHMSKQRDDLASELLKLLKKRQTKAATAAEKVLKVLEPAQDLAVGAEDLLRHARGVLERDGLLARGDVGQLSKDELHTVRKAAKAARYLSETLPENTAAKEAAAHFESLQEAGGQWHDLVDLSKEARKYLGKSHELAVRLTEERDRRMQAYRAVLSAEVKVGEAAQARAAGKKPPRSARGSVRSSAKRAGRRAAA